jgi:hypothetical protein
MALRSVKLLQTLDYLPYKPDTPRYNGKNTIYLLEYIPHSRLLHSFVHDRRKYALAHDTANVYFVTNKRGIGRVIWESKKGELIQLKGTPSEDTPLFAPYAELRDNSECGYIKELGIYMFYIVHMGFVYLQLPYNSGTLIIDSNVLILQSAYGMEYKLFVINNGAELTDGDGNRYKLYTNPADILKCPSSIENNITVFTWGGKKYALSKKENRLINAP